MTRLSFKTLPGFLLLPLLLADSPILGEPAAQSLPLLAKRGALESEQEAKLHSEKPGSPDFAAASPSPRDRWDAVWSQIQTDGGLNVVALLQGQSDGPPMRVGDCFLFRFRAPENTEAVFLAGAFNSWAHNTRGKVTNPRFAMAQGLDGTWLKLMTLPAGVCPYQYVIEAPDGNQTWVADPNVPEKDNEGHSLLDATSRQEVPIPSPKAPSISPDLASPSLSVRPEKVWVRPDESNALIITPLTHTGLEKATWKVTIRTPLGATVQSSEYEFASCGNSISIPPLRKEGGYIAEVSLCQDGQVVEQGRSILSVLTHVADDLRYGFFATFSQEEGDYDAKADMLARLKVNATEFYDYFPAHGNYAPEQEEYKSEPFGIAIKAGDVRKKIEANRRRNIASLAYVSAYAASESVYSKHPDPMTDEHGSPKVFTGEIMSEEQAVRLNKPKWFRLTNISQDSDWFKYIQEQFGRVIEGRPGILPPFDGFEIDTYGDSPDTVFHSPGSVRDGQPLRDVLHDFVGKVRSQAQAKNSAALVALNNVNEFAEDSMQDVSDFLFLELWRFHSDDLNDLVEICCHQREARRQRVVLKLYPTDMAAKQTAWPPANLACLLGAAMTGGASLMVAGEPDDQAKVMHGLCSLYYPDHRPLRSGCEELLRDYYNHDALFYGYTHGREVYNTPIQATVAGCISRVYAAPAHRALVAQLLHLGGETRWSIPRPGENPILENLTFTLELPQGIAPVKLYYATPDTPSLQIPVPLKFEVEAGKLKAKIPGIAVHGTLVLAY